MSTAEDIKNKIWAMANELRGNMDASEVPIMSCKISDLSPLVTSDIGFQHLRSLRY